jgi:ATP-dependent protease ClpP protease subunit
MVAKLGLFRPNPARSIYVQGRIDESLVDRLTPQILNLQYQSREPITAYIDSNGGDPTQMFHLLRLIKAPNQDYEASCRLITVVVTRAYSAAADLLAFGDYTLAYPGSQILFHGGRFSNVSGLTAERSSFFAQYLRLANENSALDLAKEVEFRFMFRFISSLSEFDSIRQQEVAPDMTDLDCFLSHISQHISSSAKKILEKAKKRYSRYDELVKKVLQAKKRITVNKTPAQWESVELRAIIDFEIRQNQKDPNWTFRLSGLEQLTDDFLLFRSYQDISQSERYKRICARYGVFLVSEEEAEELNQIADENEYLESWTKRAGPTLRPIWSFFVALCYTLQQGDDEFLNAQDAYWLGLIDEVIGDDSLLHMRTIRERQQAAAQAVPHP